MSNEIALVPSAEITRIPWTKFSDAHSGGGRKGEYELYFIQAPQAEAEVIFYNRFGLNPNRVSCTCCGADYSVWELEADETPADYMGGYGSSGTAYVMSAEFIEPDMRRGSLPQSGWVWQD